MIRSCALLVGLCCASVLAVPPAPVADPSGIEKNRYISLSVPSNGGEPTALRVTLTSLLHPEPGFGTGPDFTAFEGEHRWVGPPVFSTENDNDPMVFIGAPLQCTPYYYDWSTLGLFHVYGDAVMPASIYDVVALDQDCAGLEGSCVDISTPLQLTTRCRWGDLCSPCSEISSFCDVDRISFKIRRDNLVVPNSLLDKSITQLAPNTPDPSRTVNMLDLIMAADSFAGNDVPPVYPFPGPVSCEEMLMNTESVGTPSLAGRSVGGAASASGTTLKVFVTPMPAQGTATYPVGTVINNNELIAPFGGFRASFHVEFQDWNPGNLGPLLRGWQIQLDNGGFLGVNASPPAPDVDLTLPVEPCATGSAGSTHCQNLFGSGTGCSDNQCRPVFISFSSNPNWILSGGESALGGIVSSDSSPTGPIWLGVRAVFEESVPLDDGQRKYIGTLVLDIPEEAVGHVYTLNVRFGDETMVLAGGILPVDVPIAEVIPAVIRIGVPGDATGINRSRFISFVPGHSGEQMAIRVKLASLHHVVPPYAGGPSVPFSSFEGVYRWVGPPTQYVESTSTSIPFYASTLQCAPHYQEWSTTDYLHVTGSAVVPSSQYEVQFVPASCMGNEDTCAEISAPLLRETSRWGDVETPYNPPALSIQPDLADVSALVNKFRSAPGAPIKARALLVGSDLSGNIDLTTDLSFIHISACVDAFRGEPYPHTGPQACP